MQVREVEFEEKPKAELEQEVLDNHQEKVESQTEKNDEAEAETVIEYDDTKVLEYLKSKSGKELNSIDELFEEKVIEKQIELPEDVEAFYKYKKDTGRSLNDYIKLNRDLDSEDPNKILKDYYKELNPELDSEDIEFELDKFKYDEDLDDEAAIKTAKLSFKKELAKAKEHYNKIKEQYKVPLESRESSIPQEKLDKLKALDEQEENSSREFEEQKKRSDFFREKTESLFSDKFEGFKFEIADGKEMVYKPGDASTLKEQQSNLNNFISKFLNEEGYLADAEKFHKAIAVANDPEKFAKYFYEKGQADMATDFEKEDKNIDMVRSGSPVTPKSGPIIREVSSDSDSKLKFKKR